MLDCRRNVFAIAGDCDLTKKNIQAGSPVTLDPTTNKYRLAVAGEKVHGVSANSYLPTIDEVNGGDWMTNSKMIKIVKIDELVIGADLVPNESTGVLEKLYPWNEECSFKTCDKIYVDENGKYTNVEPELEAEEDSESGASTLTLDDLCVGELTHAPTATEPYMIMTVNKK